MTSYMGLLKLRQNNSNNNKITICLYETHKKDLHSDNEIVNRLLKNYQLEAVFIDEITKNVHDIYQRLATDPNVKPDEPKEIKFQVVKRSDTDYAELQMSSDAVLFMGGMAKAISDI